MQIKFPTEHVAEGLVLGAAMGLTYSFDQVVTLLGVHHFDSLGNQVIFRALKEFETKEMAPSPANIGAYLQDQDLLVKAGGGNNLLCLSEAARGLDVQYYIDKILEAYVKRRLINTATEIIDKIEEQPSEKILYESLGKLSDLDNGHDDGLKGPKVILDDFREDLSAVEDFKRQKERADSGLSTLSGESSGFQNLDDMLGGFAPKRLIVMGARPSMGKSEMVVQIITKMMEKPVPTMCFSMEMGGDEWLERMFGIVSGINFSRLKKGKISAEEAEGLIIAEEKLQSYDPYLVIDDVGTATVQQIYVRLRREIKIRGVKVAFIDHLGLLNGSRYNMSPYERTSEVSRNLKSMAMELNICIVALCQLNRNVEKRDLKTPTLSDLRDSGNIEQDADQVMMLYRKDYYDKGDHPGEVFLNLVKNRHGETGLMKFRFEWHSQTMEIYKSIEEYVPAMEHWQD